MDFDAEVIDSHVHLFPPEVIRDREQYLSRDTWFATLYSSPEARMVTADELLRQMDGAGVTMSVVFGFAFLDQGLCRTVNDYVIDAVRRYPGRLAGLACVSPGAKGAVEELERCLDAGLRGCGELAPDGQGFGAWYAKAARAGVRSAVSGDTPGSGHSGGSSDRGPAPLTAIAACLEERGLPLLVHANEPVGHHYPGKGRFTPEACFALVQTHPGLTVVLPHMGGGLFLYELMPEVKETLSHVYYDTSAVPYLYGSDVYQMAVTCAGREKIIFGSDYPLLPPGRYREGLTGLSSDDRAAILGGNARKVYRL